ncbi:nuclear export mediator factor NEMF [Enteropsectra breve]|nr:nuclear export mediator factor NEMF [Enteropsectra breve]
MKQRISSLDVRAIANELNERLVNKYIQNFYSSKQRFIYIKLSNKDILLVEPGMRIHLTHEYDTEISHFCKKLREKCRHARINRIYQHTYDRIIVIDIVRYKIVIEFFSGGNILILDENDIIVDLLRPVTELEIIKGQKYIFNDVNIHLTHENYLKMGLAGMLPFEKEFISVVESELKEKISETDNAEHFNEYFNELTSRIDNIGFFGEITVNNGKVDQLFSFPTVTDGKILKIEIPSKTDVQQLTEELEDSLHISDNALIKNTHSVVGESSRNAPEESIKNAPKEISRKIDLCDKTKVDELLKSNKKTNALHFSSLNEAMEYGFSERKKATKGKEEKAERIKKSQLGYIKDLEVQAESHKETASSLEGQREFIQEICNIFTKVYKSKMNWKVFDSFYKAEKTAGNEHAKAIKSYDLESRKAIVEIAGAFVELDLQLSVSKNIENIYAKKKKMEDKKKKTEIAMENLAEKLAPKKMSVKAQSRTPYWFERFNWFLSSEGKLVIGGKNAQDNEQIVKNYMEKDDLYFHCDVTGASSVVCKGRGDASINEAAYMALAHSKCWEEAVVRPVFWVESSQVSKTAPSGEYLTKGSFMISGKKSFVNPYRMEYGVGLLFKEENSGLLEFVSNAGDAPILHALPVAAPWILIKGYKYCVRLCPGGEKKSQVAQNIQKAFCTQSEDTPEERYVKAVGLDEYMKVVLGKSKIAVKIK